MEDRKKVSEQKPNNQRYQSYSSDRRGGGNNRFHNNYNNHNNSYNNHNNNYNNHHNNYHNRRGGDGAHGSTKYHSQSRRGWLNDK